MAVVKSMLRLGLFVIFLAKSVGSNRSDCPANQEISCRSLRSTTGFTYTVPANITCFENCKEQEQGWYFENGTFIVDSTRDASGKRLPCVQDVTYKSLTLNVCENLQWLLDCGTCKCNIIYTVTDKKHSPAHDPKEEQDDNYNYNGLPPWGITLIVGGLLVLITISFCYFRNRQCECLNKA
ncbi:uncharacterized protein LOC143713939 [Siphateles boraxobius]|uniref:uncharacterized protein LOC143713939 n=1 Tax=Siphateles boraxobius TaxID=180520 RepID=UPI00406333E1